LQHEPSGYRVSERPCLTKFAENAALFPIRLRLWLSRLSLCRLHENERDEPTRLLNVPRDRSPWRRGEVGSGYVMIS